MPKNIFLNATVLLKPRVFNENALTIMYIFPGEGYLYAALPKLIDFPISPTIIKHLFKSVLKYYHALLRTLLEDVARDYLSIGVYYLSRIYQSFYLFFVSFQLFLHLFICVRSYVRTHA